MIRVEVALEIERPPQEVFDYLVDIERVPEWQSSAAASHVDRPLGVGARIHETRRLLEREAHTVLEVSAFDPPRRLTLRTISGPVKVDIDHRLETHGDGTLLHVVAEADPGLMVGFAKPLLERQAKREVRGDFDRLKELLERG